MKLTSIDTALFEQAKAAWMGALNGVDDHEIYATEYQQIFGIIEKCNGIGELDDRFNEPVFYGILDDNNTVWALVEIVQSRKGASVWIKMLDITMSPEIETQPDNEGTTTKRLEVFTSALTGIFQLTKTIRRADTVKVYGRTEALVSFLRGMHDSFSVITSLGTISGIRVEIEGRWLVFRAAS